MALTAGPWLPSQARVGAAVATAAEPISKPLVVDGVPFVPITTSQRRECQRFSARARRPVPCPGLLPVPIRVPRDYSGPPCLGVFAETACSPGVIQPSRSLFVLSRSNFMVPRNYEGVSFQQYNGAAVPMKSIAGGPLGRVVFMTGTAVADATTMVAAARR